jgi:AcrR family transcriptional regulator
MTQPPAPPAASAKQRAAAERCEAMVHHARVQIMAVGVDRFSVNEVLRLSGGSKATLAKYFGGRNGLIAAAIHEEARTAIAAMKLDSDDGLATPLEVALGRALAGVLEFYLRPGSLALYRALISAAPEGTAAAEGFYNQGHRVIVEAIAVLLEQRKPGQVRPDLECSDVADQLVHAIRAGAYEQTLIGLPPADAQGAIARRVERTLALVLPGIAAHRST